MPSSPTRSTPPPVTLYADTLEQLAYGAENAVWRNFFLSGATELRDGNFGTPTQTTSLSMLAQLTPEQMFDSFAISVNGPRAWDLDLAIDVTFARRRDQLPADPAQRGAGPPQGARRRGDGAATVTLANKLRLLMFAAGDATSPGLNVTGDADALPSRRRAGPPIPVQHHTP